jgi:uncharacterized protein
MAILPRKKSDSIKELADSDAPRNLCRGTSRNSSKLFKQLNPNRVFESRFLMASSPLGDTKIQQIASMSLKDPILIQGLPGLGYVGKVGVDYFIEKLKPQKIAELYSSYLLFPDGNLGINISEDGTYSLPKYEFYAYNEREPHAIFLTGDSQPSVTGQYEVASMVLDYAQQLGGKMVFTMGGYGTRAANESGVVYAVVGDSVLGDRLKKLGAKLAKGGAVTGAAGVILGIGRQRGMQCAGLLGATSGVYPDLEAARAVIQMLTGLVGMPVELAGIDVEIEDLRKKMEKIHRPEPEEAREGEEKGGEEDKGRYIT